MKPNLTLILLLCFTVFITISCRKFVSYNADEARVKTKFQDLNKKNIDKLKLSPEKDSFSFLVISDSQRAYKELDDFVSTVNQLKNNEFVILNGDITDFGLNSEYEWIAERLQNLLIPYIVVIGNHDMLANGRDIYRQMFGVENFSFEVTNFKFIFLNSNSREVGLDGSLPDLNWLRNELNTAAVGQKIIVVSHIAPFSGDFDHSLEMSYSQMLTENRNVLYSIHGHEAKYIHGQPYGPPVTYLVSNSLNSRSYVLFKINGDDIQVEEKFF